MLAAEKSDIEATIRILEKLDRQSLLLINSGAKLLAARQDMDKENQEGKQLQEAQREVRKISGTKKAEIVEVIRTKSVIGEGTKENPVQIIIQYWDKNGRLICSQEEEHHRGEISD